MPKRLSILTGTGTGSPKTHPDGRAHMPPIARRNLYARCIRTFDFRWAYSLKRPSYKGSVICTLIMLHHWSMAGEGFGRQRGHRSGMKLLLGLPEFTSRFHVHARSSPFGQVRTIARTLAC